MQGASTSGYAFTGREWDAETGLAFYRARYYSPQTGRWLNEDPIGLAGGSHLSAYVSNNPTRLIDPFGLCGDQPGESLKDRVVRNLMGFMDMLTLAEPVQAPGVGEADSPVPDRSPDTAILIAMTFAVPALQKSGVTLLQSSGSIVELGITKSGKTSQVLAEAYLEGGTLTLKRAHVQGELTLRELIEQAKLFGRENRLTRIVVEGAERTTGAKPGHVPRPITINVEPK